MFRQQRTATYSCSNMLELMSSCSASGRTVQDPGRAMEVCPGTSRAAMLLLQQSSNTTLPCALCPAKHFIKATSAKRPHRVNGLCVHPWCLVHVANETKECGLFISPQSQEASAQLNLNTNVSLISSRIGSNPSFVNVL